MTSWLSGYFPGRGRPMEQVQGLGELHPAWRQTAPVLPVSPSRVSMPFSRRPARGLFIDRRARIAQAGFLVSGGLAAVAAFFLWGMYSYSTTGGDSWRRGLDHCEPSARRVMAQDSGTPAYFQHWKKPGRRWIVGAVEAQVTAAHVVGAGDPDSVWAVLAETSRRPRGRYFDSSRSVPTR